MIFLRYVFNLHKSIYCGYSLEGPHSGISNVYPQHMFFMENWRKLSQNHHQILFFNKSSGHKKERDLRALVTFIVLDQLMLPWSVENLKNIHALE